MTVLEKIAREKKHCPHGYKIVNGRKVCIYPHYYGIGGLRRVVKIVKKNGQAKPPAPGNGGQGGMNGAGGQGGGMMMPSGD